MFELLATACSGIFAGAAIYISVGQGPAAREVGDDTAAALFGPMYRRGAPMQASLALIGSISGFIASATGGGVGCFVGALLLGSVVPFTLVVIKPVNDQLLSPDLDTSSPEVPALLDRWARLHAVRSVASGLAFGLFLVS